MTKKLIRVIGQLIIYLPLIGIVIGSSVLKLSAFQHQLLMLFLLIWVNVFFLYKSWLSS